MKSANKVINELTKESKEIVENSNKRVNKISKNVEGIINKLNLGWNPPEMIEVWWKHKLVYG